MRNHLKYSCKQYFRLFTIDRHDIEKIIEKAKTVRQEEANEKGFDSLKPTQKFVIENTPNKTSSKISFSSDINVNSISENDNKVNYDNLKLNLNENKDI